MDDRRFGAEVREVPDEVRVHLTGDLNGRADETLSDAYAQVAALGPHRSASTSGALATSTAPASRSSCGCWRTPGATVARSGRSA